MLVVSGVAVMVFGDDVLNGVRDMMNEDTDDNSSSDTEAPTGRGEAGKLEKSKTGKGSVPPSQRDKKRVPSAKEKAEERKAHDNNCANCGNKTEAKDTEHHHYPERHSDGGKKTVPVCKDCHKYLHKR